MSMMKKDLKNKIIEVSHVTKLKRQYIHAAKKSGGVKHNG